MSKTGFLKYRNYFLMILAAGLGFVFPLIGVGGFLALELAGENPAFNLSKDERTMVRVALGIFVVYMMLNIIYSIKFVTLPEDSLPSELLRLIFVE